MTAPELSIPAFEPFYSYVVPTGVIRNDLPDVAAPVVEHGRLDDVLHGVRSALVEAVEMHAFRMMVGEFHDFREHRGWPQDASRHDALERFREHLHDPQNCQRVLDRYPVLLRRLDTIMRNAIEAYRELFVAFGKDRHALASAGLIEDPATRGAAGEDLISTVFPTGGDRHNDGRQVFGVRVASGNKLVFKPRTLASDRFVLALYEAAEPYLKHSLRGCMPTSVAAGSHGWQRHVRPVPMETPEQQDRYFYRFGALCAVYGAIGASDLHDGNVLAFGENPCVIDTETVLRPEPDAGMSDRTLPRCLLDHMGLSMVSTMLVPVVNPTSPIDVIMAGVGVAGDQQSSLLRSVVRDGDSDGVRVAREPFTYTHEANVPHCGDVPVSATENFDQVVAGYLDALDFVRSGDIDTVLDKHADISVRCLLRSTVIYGKFIDASTHPDYLRSFDEEDRLFGLLGGFPDHMSRELAEYIRDEERASMRIGDIPYFTTEVSAKELSTPKGRGPRAHQDTPLEFARRGVELNATCNDTYHRFLLEESFSEVVGADRPEGLNSQNLFGRATLGSAAAGSWWREIARQIAAVSVECEGPDGPEVGWVCGIGPGRNAATVTPGNYVSFHDIGGIVNFLDRAAEHDPDLREFHLSAQRGLGSLAAEYSELLMRVPESVYSGAASLLLTRPADVHAEWFDEVLDRIEKRAVAGEVETDLSNGPAGILMVLLAQIERGAPSALCDAGRLARLRELVTAHAGEQRSAGWCDIAHGELGMRWAMSRVGRVLGDRDLVTGAAEWLLGQWESGIGTRFAGWCNGAAGQLLAAAEILVSAGKQNLLSGQRRSRLLDQATHLPADAPVDLSVCHGSSGVVQSLIATYALLGDDRLVDAAEDYQRRVLNHARSNGYYTGTPGRTSLLGYMLGWSGVGDTDALLRSARNGGGDAVCDLRVPVAFAGKDVIDSKGEG